MEKKCFRPAIQTVCTTFCHIRSYHSYLNTSRLRKPMYPTITTSCKEVRIYYTLDQLSINAHWQVRSSFPTIELVHMAGICQRAVRCSHCSISSLDDNSALGRAAIDLGPAGVASYTPIERILRVLLRNLGVLYVQAHSYHGNTWNTRKYGESWHVLVYFATVSILGPVGSVTPTPIKAWSRRFRHARQTIGWQAGSNSVNLSRTRVGWWICRPGGVMDMMVVVLMWELLLSHDPELFCAYLDTPLAADLLEWMVACSLG